MDPLQQGIPPLRHNVDPLNPHTDSSRVNPDDGKQSSDADQPSSSETHKDQKKQDLSSEKSPEALKHAQASKLAGWVKQSAALLQQLEKKATPAQNKPELKFRDEVEQLKDGAIREEIAEGQQLAAQTIAAVGSLKLLGADVNMEAVSGFGYASTVGKELTAGIDLLGSKWKLNNLKLEKEAIAQQIDDFLEQMDELFPEEQKAYDPVLADLTRKKMHVDKQIYEMEKSDWKKAFSFLTTHLESIASAVVAVLRQTHDNAGLIAASGGGTGIGAFGMLASTGGVFKGILNYSKIDDQLVDIIKVSENHENPNVSSAIGAVKTVALDHTASHQKSNIVIGVLENAFTFCQSGISTAMGIITLVSLTTAGTAVGTGAATAAAGLSPGVPVVMGIGLLIAGAVAIYKNRHTIGRGIKELRAGNYSPERNLTFRQWKRKKEFKFISRKLLELGEQHAKIEAGTASNKTVTEKARDAISSNDGSFYSMVASVARAGGIIAKGVISALGDGIDKALFAGESKHVFKIDQRNIGEVDQAISQLAERFFELKNELEKIESKQEGQRLSDETGDISGANVTTANAIDSAIKDMETRISNIDDVTAQLYHVDFKVAEAAYKKMKAKSIRLAERSEKELDKRYAALLNPSESTKESVRSMYDKKIEEKTDQLRLLGQDLKKDKTTLEAEVEILKREIAELKEFNRDDGATGLEFEKNRISEMRIKVKSDLELMRKPGRNEFHGLAEILDRKRAELVNNIEMLKAKETQVQNQILIQLGIDDDPDNIELNELDGKSVITSNAVDGSQQRLVEAIKVLGEGDELREFAAVFEKMGVSFEDMDSRQHKNLYVQSQIQKAITAQTIVWK